MSTTLGNVTALADTARNAMLDALDALINTGGGTAVLRLRSSVPTVLVTFNLQNPAFGNAASGSMALAGTPLTATASAGSATTPADYQILDRGGTLQVTGAVSSTDGITTGQTCNLNSFSLTMPAT